MAILYGEGTNNGRVAVGVYPQNPGCHVRRIEGFQMHPTPVAQTSSTRVWTDCPCCWPNTQQSLLSTILHMSPNHAQDKGSSHRHIPAMCSLYETVSRCAEQIRSTRRYGALYYVVNTSETFLAGLTARDPASRTRGADQATRRGNEHDGTEWSSQVEKCAPWPVVV